MSREPAQTADVLDPVAVLRRASLLHSPRAVTRALARMAREIEAVLGAADPVIVAVMQGGMFTAVALAAHWQFPYEFDYAHLTRYGKGLTGGALDWRVRPSADLTGRTVLLVDDVLDRGLTLAALQQELARIGVARQYTAALVVKELREPVDRPGVDFRGFTVKDVYVFGCGMDYKGYWRGLRGLYAAGDGCA
jgi:hypoxanthine phosphoribosyltransferase